ncbi:MAG: TPR repeat-containing protein YrrB [Chlamydiae bacterium]|nr:TPR repeat-containing protein YrrB [Chlamydiota bacterium]
MTNLTNKKSLPTQCSLLFAMAFLLFGCDTAAAQPDETEFVNSQICGNCHQKQYNEWKGSHHDLAMDYANEKTVLGDFNNSTFAFEGVTSTFYKRDGDFFVKTDGPDGTLQDYKITYVFGYYPLQQYMIEFSKGKVQVLDIGWDTHSKEEGGQRWFHLHPDDNVTHKHIFHWTKRFLNWNYMCAECHSTNLQKNYNFTTDSFHTTWSEINVGCQGCHGPGSKHIEWTQSAGKKNTDVAFLNKGLEVDLKAKDSHVQIEGCARCHSRRNSLREDYAYGKQFMDYYEPRLLLDPLYYPDGQILDEVYVYGSFIQSKKYQQGVRCSDCHNPHSIKLQISGNALCVSCHDTSPSREFEGVARKNYDTPDHHFHKTGSPGAQCVNCHMPTTNYMIVDPRLDHSFQIPRPDLSVALGVPNSCNRCHTEKTPEWAVNAIDLWYPTSKEKREKEKHFGFAFAAGQEGKPEAEPELLQIAEDKARPPIIRATALNILHRYPSPQTFHIMVSSLEEDHPLMRQEAVKGIGALLPRSAGEEAQKKKLSLLSQYLQDPILAVRTEAAKVLTEMPATIFTQEQKGHFEKALEEYKKRQEAIADRPEAHLNLGIMYQNLGQNSQAESSYQNAIRLDKDYLPARFNLANLYNAEGKNKEAKQTLRDIIAIEPDNGEAYYSLGLLLAEMNRYDEAVDALSQAVTLLPERTRVSYNYALTLIQLGRNKDAEAEILKAYQKNVNNPEIIYLLITLYAQEGKWKEALPYAEKLVQLMPEAPLPKQILKEVQSHSE